MQYSGELHGDVGGVIGAKITGRVECGGGGNFDRERFWGGKKGRDD